MMKLNIFWFRRDLRLTDNKALNAALSLGNVLPIFIFDKGILDRIDKDDSRLSFIHSVLTGINQKLKKHSSGIKTFYGTPLEVFEKISLEYDFENVFWNKDYEPYAINRDLDVQSFLESKKINVHTFKDQVIFEENEVMKDDGKPYTVYTPYKNKWLSMFHQNPLSYEKKSHCNFDGFIKIKSHVITLGDMGFTKSKIRVRDFSFEKISDYENYRDFPSKDFTSYLSPHLRFGTVSVRMCVDIARTQNSTFLSELIWREFFMQILFHFPHVAHSSFRPKYDNIEWLNNKNDFERWCNGMTGYPLVDAGMRQLNETGYMHNRVRMITASFLVKHLLVDWRWGERYFAKKLLDYEMSSNNGNWQWAAGTGCDSSPYFRIFNPTSQLKKFDSNLEYVKKWVTDLRDPSYPKEVVDHKFARERCLNQYKIAVK